MSPVTVPELVANSRLWVHDHRVLDHDVPAVYGVKHRDVIECRVVPQLLRKPLPQYADVTPLPLLSYEVLYPQPGSRRSSVSASHYDTQPAEPSHRCLSSCSGDYGERPKLTSFPPFSGSSKTTCGPA